MRSSVPPKKYALTLAFRALVHAAMLAAVVEAVCGPDGVNFTVTAQDGTPYPFVAKFEGNMQDWVQDKYCNTTTTVLRACQGVDLPDTPPTGALKNYGYFGDCPCHPGMYMDIFKMFIDASMDPATADTVFLCLITMFNGTAEWVSAQHCHMKANTLNLEYATCENNLAASEETAESRLAWLLIFVFAALIMLGYIFKDKLVATYNKCTGRDGYTDFGGLPTERSALVLSAANTQDNGLTGPEGSNDSELN